MKYLRYLLFTSFLALIPFSSGTLLGSEIETRGFRHDRDRFDHRDRGRHDYGRFDRHDRGRHDWRGSRYDHYHFNRHPGVTFAPRSPGTHFSFSIGRDYYPGRLYRPPVVVYPGRHFHHRPAYGTIVTHLPLGCERVYYGTRVIYRYENVYYAPNRSGYVVLNPATLSQETAPTSAETREAVRKALEEAAVSTSTSAAASELVDAAPPAAQPVASPLEYLPAGYATHYVNGAPVYEVSGDFYRWDPARHAYIAAPGPAIKE